jgi:hypothetical protein
LGQAGILGGGVAAAQLVVGDLMEVVGWGSPERAAKAVLNSLEEHADPEVESSLRQQADAQERARVQSVYVDLSEKGAVISSPTKFTVADARNYLERAIVGLRALNFVASPTRPDVNSFIASLPRKWRAEGQAKATEMVAKFVGES